MLLPFNCELRISLVISSSHKCEPKYTPIVREI